MSRSATAAGARRRPRVADDRRRLLIGVGLVVLVYVATASYAALTLPLPGTRDSTFHLDYVYQVALGQLPAAEGYELYPGRGGRQFASAHRRSPTP
ncbi:MAG: hypothetical protein GXX90_05015 [Microbacteriaceae bacterium]|nr:hypothetical protein [Microbacteriaceae bacterium]